MDPFEQILNQLAGCEQDGPLESGHHMILLGLIMAMKPEHVLQIGIGTGFTTANMVFALTHNKRGQLTCIEDWHRFQGKPPEGIDRLHKAGVVLNAPVDPAEFLEQSGLPLYDFIVAEGWRINSRLTPAVLLSRLSKNGWLLVTGSVDDTRQQRLQDLHLELQQKGHSCLLFHRQARSDAVGQHGLLVVRHVQSPLKQGSPQDAADVLHPSTRHRTDDHHDETALTVPSSATTLYLGLVKGDNYGWGVCSRYLIQELSKLCPTRVLDAADGSDCNPHLNGPLFQALANVAFDPMFPHASGSKNVGYTFFENELTAQSVENAKRFDLVLGGSTWCRDRMREKGIDHCDVLIQGIDPELFYPIETIPEDDRFVIFSGGKFELRKGQDLVLRAIKILQDRYPDVWLVNCWYNMWPASTRLMGYSKHIRFSHRQDEPWTRTMQRTYRENGLDDRRIQTFELVPHQQQRDLFATTHIGLFPNRCEGGTNLVLMEYMACGKPVIASFASGHKDMLTPQNALLLESMEPVRITDADNRLVARWAEPSLDEIVERLDDAYHHRHALREIGKKAGQDMRQWTWRHSAKRLFDLVVNV